MGLSKKEEEEKEWDTNWGGWAVSEKTDWGGESCPVESIFQEEWESDTTQSLNQFFGKIILCVSLVGIWLVKPPFAYAVGNERERGSKVSNDIAQVVTPTRTRGVPVPVENRLDWGELQRVRPNPYKPNPTPVARRLGGVPLIDRSPGHEEKWTGNLSRENLQSQYK